jgi:hypothetical protein
MNPELLQTVEALQKISLKSSKNRLSLDARIGLHLNSTREQDTRPGGGSHRFNLDVFPQEKHQKLNYSTSVHATT